MKQTVVVLSIVLGFLSVGCSETSFSTSGSSSSSKAGAEDDAEVQDDVRVDDVAADDEIDSDEDALLEENACEGNKVKVCHVPGGNPENAHTICISKNALKAHVGRHGQLAVNDSIGECATDESDRTPASDDVKKERGPRGDDGGKCDGDEGDEDSTTSDDSANS